MQLNFPKCVLTSCVVHHRFRGNLTNVMRSGPQKALDFFAFDSFKAMGLQTFVAAGLAGATGNTLLYPLEVGTNR